MIMPIQRVHNIPPHRIQLYFIAPLLQRIPQFHTRRRPVGTGHAVEGIVDDDAVVFSESRRGGVPGDGKRLAGAAHGEEEGLRSSC